MIDLNTHIKMTDCLESDINYLTNIAGELKQQGVTDCVLTPSTNYFLINEEFDQKYEKLINSVSTKVNGINFRKGTVLKLSTFNEYEGDLDKYLITGTNYVNLELSYRQKWKEKYFSKIEDFIAISNFIPIITTIESYPAIHNNPNLVQNLINSECIISASIEFVLSKKNRKLIFKLINHDLIDVLVTSYSYENFSEVKIKKAIKVLEKKFGEDKIQNLLNNSLKILNNNEIERNYHKPFKKFLWFYL